MKKLVALLLVLVIPFTSIYSAAAQPLLLPKQLKEIADEAFRYTPELDVVDIPWGTESIGSKAFADSGLSKVYIPSTVLTIAEDASDGADITIVTPDGTYAKEYADAHGFQWEDGSAHYGRDTLSGALDILENAEAPEAISMDRVAMTPVSTEGITDAGTLEAYARYNQMITEYETMAAEAEAEYEKLADALTQLADGISGAVITAEDGSVGIDLDGYTYTLAGDAMERLSPDYEIVSIGSGEDGSVVTEVVSSGTTYYLTSSLSGTSISSMPAAAPAGAYVRTMSADGGDSLYVLDMISGFLDQLSDLVSNVDMAVESAVITFDNKINHLEKMAEEIKNDPSLASRYTECLKELENARKNLAAVKWFKNMWKGLSIAGTIHSMIVDRIKIMELISLSRHGHPLGEIALDQERYDLINRMNEDNIQAQWMYIGDSLLNLMNLLTEIAAIVGLAPSAIPGVGIVAVGIAALSKSIQGLLVMYAAQACLGHAADSKYDAVHEADDKLHTFVYGLITDEDTGEAVENVIVTNGSITVRGNADGTYKTYLLPGDHTLIFVADDYEREEVKISLSPLEELEQDVELTPLYGASVYGIVTGKETGEPLEGVHVTCGELEMYTDASGSYRFDELEPGDYTISFFKTGYVRWEQTFPLEEEQEFELNVALDSCYLITNREELEAVANDVMGHYTLMNNIDLSGAPWTPLPWFSGTLDGNGYSITGMQISGNAGDYVGLFSGLYNGHVFNLDMYSLSVSPTANASFMGVGAICGGLNNGSSLTNCTVSGSVNVTSGSGNRDIFVGGLAGYSDHGYISACHSGADVTVVTPNTAHAGGLAGILKSGRAEYSNADGSVSVVQTGSNSGARLNAFGTLYSSASPAYSCNSRGHVTAQSTNGAASAYGVAMSDNSTNSAPVSAATESGSAFACGYHTGSNGTNNASVMATASGSGTATARGVENIDGGSNSGTITATAVSGYATASGAQDVGSGVENSGTVSAESVSGGTNVHGLIGRGSSSECSNTGSVTATGQTGQSLAVGVYGCSASTNYGDVTAVSSKGTAVGQGMTACTDSTNYGSVDVTYKGTDGKSGGLSAQGLNTCSGSTNIGNIKGKSEASNTQTVVTGVQGGSNNVNQGSVTSISAAGMATARGVCSSSSQNYGSVLAQSDNESKGSSANATAYGVGSGYTDSFNGGSVTAISKSSVAYAYGTGGGRGCSSTGLVSAEAHLFYEEEDESGAWGELGRAFASNSTSTQATVAGFSVSASGGETRNMYYFIAGSSCSDHHDMGRQFVSYKSGEDSHLDGCFVPCGSAQSDAG